MRDRKILKRSSEGVDAIDQNRLAVNRYAELSSAWKTVYVIRHRKYENKIAELRATSFVHACNLIGWKHKHVELVTSFPAGN